eukprot:gene20330-26390_t
MGNKESTLGDEPTPEGVIADRSLIHFEHMFKGEIYETFGPLFVNTYGDVKRGNRQVQILCKGKVFEVIEDVGITGKRQIEVGYTQVTGIGFDHGKSQVKFNIAIESEDNFIILTMANSIEFEQEMKLRFGVAASANREFRIPTPMYMGMFAGATKPKPFQRKRPNQSLLPAGKLPSLHEMRNTALLLQKGSYKPCPAGESRRVELAMQHIYEGRNEFKLLSVRGIPGVSNQWRSESTMLITDESIIFKPFGGANNQSIEFSFDDISDWSVVDNDHLRIGDSFIQVTSTNGDSIILGVPFIRDAKHTLEYYWNNYRVNNGKPVKLGSTHGRPIVSVTTLSGEDPVGEPPVGQPEVVDQDGIVVRPGAKMIQRRNSGLTSTKEQNIVPSENKAVKKHWFKVVVHQGWLLKKGGVGIGAAKNWIKRYFVLYKTSQGHFLIYYSDFTECPMYTSAKNHRNIVDLAKTTFIRPGSNKAEYSDTPPHSFDIVTTEREWTLCAESQENVQRWLKILNHAVDADVAILPDEELIFKVKPKVDPLGMLPAGDYSTALRVSANGVSVTAPDPTNNGTEREFFFWVYTDFYKWSLLSQVGKLALLVNVFADSSFSRRNEYIFRTKEAVRLATAIEYFIEKFMSVMHVRLETMEEDPESNQDISNSNGNGLQQASADEFGISFTDDFGSNSAPPKVAEIDLLGLDNDEPTTILSPSVNRNVVDPFGDDPFGDSSSSSLPPPPPTTLPNQVLDPFGDDPFGNDDLFGGAPKLTSPSVKVAPPLSPAQINQHRQWLFGVLQNGIGPIYDDGILQVMVKLDIRLSQAKLVFNYRNQSPGTLSDFKIEFIDSNGLIRFEAGPLKDSVPGLGQFQQQLMVECMKPVSPGVRMKILYNDTLSGLRDTSIDIPLFVTTFNEPLTLPAQDFANRWIQAAQNEGQEIVKPLSPIHPPTIHAALSGVFKYSRILGLPDESDYVIYGAATLRTGTIANGEKISVGSLVKIEMNIQANAMRITVRALHPAVTSAVIDTVKLLLV